MSATYLAKDVLYFLPKAVPKVAPLPPGALPTGEVLPMTAYGFPPHGDYRHFPPDRFVAEIAAWVRNHDDGQGRILVEWWWLGEHLMARTNAQILGGFRQRNMDHRAANLFHRHPKADLPDEELEQYLTTYAVRWVILSSAVPALEHRDVLEFVERVGPHRIYRSRAPVSLTVDGNGQVRASLNRIEVTGTDPDRDAVLRFHWFETLACEPDCRIEREPIAGNRVGFIRVPAPHPPSFAIVNRY